MSARRVQQALIMVLVAAGVALLLADFFHLGGDSPKKATKSATTSFATVRPVKPVTRGSALRREDLEVKLQAVATPPGTLSSVSDAQGRLAARDLAAGEVVSTSNTLAAPTAGTLAMVIPTGLRAVALRVTDDTAVANLIQPGDRVDVLVVSTAGRPPEGVESFPRAEARTILQNIAVLAVGDLFAGGAKSGPAYRNVTLAVTPKQAAMIALTRTVGTQVLTLRAREDMTDSAPGASLTTDDLHLSDTGRVIEASRAPASSGRAVEVIAGSTRSTALVPQGSVP